jgi:Ca-activated chloride channel family protein
VRARHALVASITLLLLLTLVGALLLARVPAKASPVPQISVQVNLVSVPVTVTDARGEFVSKLSRENFRMLVDGTEQPIEYFSSEEEPAQVLILLETGPAVYLLQGEHIAAASVFLSGLSADDRVAVASYGEAPQLLLDFTTDKRRAAASLQTANYGLGRANLNFYASMASVLDWVASAGGKRAIVALTTGLDSSGPGPWQHLVERMQQSNVLVLPVALGGELRDTGPRSKKPNESGAPPGEELSFAESTRVLETIAAETGGHAFFPKKARDFENAYRQIAGLLRHQYSLGFTAAVGDGHYHAIHVELVGAPGQKRGRDYRINSRRGFLAPTQ